MIGEITEQESATIAEALQAHKSVLQISGGKDSLACLYLLRPYWDLLTVAWLNTGAAFPETVEQMAEIREMVPHFMEVKADQPEHIRGNGFPVDVVPIRNTKIGKLVQPNDSPLLQPSMECCAANLWVPMQKAMQAFGAQLLIRGQRADEARGAPITNGYTEGGMVVWFPIEHWTEQRVFDYLKAEGVKISSHYEYTEKSLDCWDCTAYLDESAGRMRYTREKHPDLWLELERRLVIVRKTVQGEVSHLDAALIERT